MKTPANIFNFGAPGLDKIKELNLLKREVLSEAIGFQLDKKYFMVTYHPVTLFQSAGASGLSNLLSVLDEYPDYQLIISYPNADTNYRELIDILNQYYQKNKHRTFLSRSLGQLKYLSCLKHCEFVIGNSSSGIIEAPTLGIPTINIGDRQKGRITGDTVINCDDRKEAIKNAIDEALSKKFSKRFKIAKNPYGSGDASKKLWKNL